MVRLVSILGGLEGNKMITIFDVANYFITKSKNDEDVITPLKIQKLCYYAQAWSLVWDNKQLFNEDFEAWVHGPANYDLYKKYKSTGRNDIIEENPKFNLSIFSKEQLETLEAVWDAYGKFTGAYLEQLTHQERPWKETRGALGPGENCNKIISKSLIKEYFKEQDGKKN